MKLFTLSLPSAFAVATFFTTSQVLLQAVNGQANDVEVPIPCVEGALNVVDAASCQDWCTSNESVDGVFEIVNDGQNTQCACQDGGQTCQGVNVGNPIEPTDPQNPMEPDDPSNPIEGTPSNPIEVPVPCADVGVTSGQECIDWCGQDEFASVLYNNCECFTSTQENRLVAFKNCIGVAGAENPIEPEAPGSPENPIEVPIDCNAGAVNVVDAETCESFCLLGQDSDFGAWNVDLGLCQCFVASSQDRTLMPTTSCNRPPPSTTTDTTATTAATDGDVMLPLMGDCSMDFNVTSKESCDEWCIGIGASEVGKWLAYFRDNAATPYAYRCDCVDVTNTTSGGEGAESSCTTGDVPSGAVAVFGTTLGLAVVVSSSAILSTAMAMIMAAGM
eukprot:CAMPEP_0113470980 /NCGR_PEP_ID=MMETSP0014_2-20120614/16736_1 /TAXON_ID=2857 /ORGANISM="Nitzschia sp." /LENGTH=388 /DNA_ID=CAMNT_0000363589 /DNA_START=93 /DNA_END=1259 /DNA_ORIENTATION=+ /assembly_acc=CAM_ASM_000159